MDIININNGSSGHFDSENVIDTTPSVREAETIAGGNFEKENHMIGLGTAGEKNRRKRKTRRFKSRYKGKSFKKSKYNSLKKMRSRVYPQSEAPNNTNEFLMADHNNLENLDDKLAVPNNYFKDCEKNRMRESSFTSADSDDGQFYSSPEDEDEFLTKDFDNTYQSVCAEKFGNLSKAQLTKIIFDLEAKVEELSKVTHANTQRPDGSVNGIDSKDLRVDMKEVWLENERLRVENDELRRFIKENAVTTSSSSSSSSSGDSDSDSGSDNANRSIAEDQNPKAPPDSSIDELT